MVFPTCSSPRKEFYPTKKRRKLPASYQRSTKVLVEGNNLIFNPLNVVGFGTINNKRRDLLFDLRPLAKVWKNLALQSPWRSQLILDFWRHLISSGRATSWNLSLALILSALCMSEILPFSSSVSMSWILWRSCSFFVFNVAESISIPDFQVGFEILNFVWSLRPTHLA